MQEGEVHNMQYGYNLIQQGGGKHIKNVGGGGVRESKSI